MGKTALAMVAAILVIFVLSGCSGGEQDTTAPRISAVSIRDATRTSVVITWVTDEPATSQVDYGLADRYDRSTRVGTKLVVNHSVILMGLDANATYHYRVYSMDAAGNEAFSADSTFTTSDISPPLISEVGVDSVTKVGATITWTTSEPATSQVQYGPTDEYGFATALDALLVTAHTVNLTGLSAKTTYHFRVRSKDASSREGYSGDYTFTTGTAKSVVASSAAATIMAGNTQADTAVAFDRFNNSLGDVTSTTVFSIDAGAGGTWGGDYDNVCTSQNAGTWTVTGDYGVLRDTATLTVNAGPAVSLDLKPDSGLAYSGEKFTVTVTAYDAFGSVATGYTGTVHFSSTDGLALLPEAYAFTASDNGIHTFNVTLVMTGFQSVQVTDGTLTDSGSWTVFSL